MIPASSNGPDAGERAFAYAKMCGIIGKSFVGKRIGLLKRPQTLTELDRLVFPGAEHHLPERELLVDLERRILKRTIRHIFGLLNSYSAPPGLLALQLRACEYADLKTCLHHINAGKPAPNISDIGRFKSINFEAYPNRPSMLGGTEFECILPKLEGIKSANFDLSPAEAELDLRYYALLLESLKKLSAHDRQYAQKILAEEISLRNCVWALRLRTYFNKPKKETQAYLINIHLPGGASLAAEAIEALDFPLNSRIAWKNWRWEKFLNPQKTSGAGAGRAWAVNPRFFQNTASQYISRLAMRCFRIEPFSVSSGFCFIKIKQFEEDLLTSVVEGLGLGMGSPEIFRLLEVPA
jgi:hypothetical protein